MEDTHSFHRLMPLCVPIFDVVVALIRLEKTKVSRHPRQLNTNMHCFAEAPREDTDYLVLHISVGADPFLTFVGSSLEWGH